MDFWCPHWCHSLGPCLCHDLWNSILAAARNENISEARAVSLLEQNTHQLWWELRCASQRKYDGQQRVVGAARRLLINLGPPPPTAPLTTPLLAAFTSNLAAITAESPSQPSQKSASSQPSTSSQPATTSTTAPSQPPSEAKPEITTFPSTSSSAPSGQPPSASATPSTAAKTTTAESATPSRQGPAGSGEGQKQADTLDLAA